MNILNFFRAAPAKPAVDYEQKFKAAATELRLANDARDNWRASSKDWEAKFKQSVQDMAGLSDEVERLRKELAEERQLSERFRSERDELRPDAEAMRKKRQDDRDRAQAKRDGNGYVVSVSKPAPKKVSAK